MDNFVRPTWSNAETSTSPTASSRSRLSSISTTQRHAPPSTSATHALAFSLTDCPWKVSVRVIDST